MNKKEKKVGKWFANQKDFEVFADWLNRWGDCNKHMKYEILEKERNAFRRGYHKAVSDFYDRLGLEFKIFDKRTKTGFKQNLQRRRKEK